MPIAGIIAEYNPFHNGHAYQLRKVREMGFDKIVVVMSGAFVQRGEPAVCAKRNRVEMALRGGADAVLELPLWGVLSSAQGFARCGVDVLAATGVVTDLCFGSECGDIGRLKAVAQALQRSDLDEALREELAGGISYPAARQKALARFCEDASLLKNPNDLLGIEYIMALQGRMTPHAIARVGAAHDSMAPSAGSASFCRAQLAAGQDVARFVPEYVLPLLKDTVFLSDMERAMLARLRGLTAVDFARLPDVSEGLEHKIAAAVREGCSIEEIIDRIKSKRYTRSRICRILMRAYLDLPQSVARPEHIRILGFRKQSSDLIRRMREQATLPIVQHPAVDGCGSISLRQDMAANDVWSAFASRVQAAGSDYREFPVVI